MSNLSVTKKSTKSQKGTKKTDVKKSETNHARHKLDADQGNHISAARVKLRFDTRGINEHITNATDELTLGEPHPLLDSAGKLVSTTLLVPISDMSVPTRSLAEKSSIRYDAGTVIRHEKLTKSLENLKTDWATTKSVLNAKQLDKTLTDKDYKLQLAAAEKTFDTKLASITDELTSPPLVINAKKLTHTVHEEAIAKIQKYRTRVSRKTPVVIASAASVWLTELITHGMKKVVADGMSFLKVPHILSDGIDNLSLLPFYKNTPTFRQAERDEVKRRADEETKKQLRNQRKKSKKSDVDTADTVEETLPEVVDQDQQQEDDDDDDDDDEVPRTTNFKHHVKLVCLAIQNDMEKTMSKKMAEPYLNIRISDDIKVFCSNLISDFIGSLNNIVQCELRRNGVTTVNPQHIYHVLEMYLNIFEHNPTQFLEDTRKRVDKYNVCLANKNEARRATKVAKDALKLSEETK
jgi:hypothetical protein